MIQQDTIKLLRQPKSTNKNIAPYIYLVYILIRAYLKTKK